MVEAVAAALVAYNNLLNLWGPFHRWAYLPLNLAAAGALLALALGPLQLEVVHLGLAGGHLRAGLTGGLLGAGLTLPLIALATVRAGGGVLADRRFAGEGLTVLGYRVLVRIPLGTALLEELAFRGVLIGLVGPTLEAILLSSVAFGLWHVTPTLYALRINEPGLGTLRKIFAVTGAVILTAGAGVLLAVLRLVTGSLAAPLAAHWAINSNSTIAAWIALRRQALLS